MQAFIFRHSILFLFLLSTLHSFAQDNQATDRAIDKPLPYEIITRKTPVKIESTYLTMRDGVKIAVDVYMPRDVKKGKQYPVIFHQTRYWRRMKLKWPYNWIAGDFVGAYGKMFRKLLSNEYVVVNVDTRGTGASLGSRRAPWSPEEVEDAGEIMDWIVDQDWCNGKIGLFGVSYTGTAAEMALHTQHPNVKCLITMYGFFDIYDDIGFPGGVRSDFVAQDWSRINKFLDKNELPDDEPQLKKFIKGVKPVKGQKHLLDSAVDVHARNYDLYANSLEVMYRDDEREDVLNLDMVSPYSYASIAKQANVPIYSYSGWLDGANSHASVKRFLTVDNPGSKLTIGPWGHGGFYNISPANPGKSQFDHVAEAMKFLDHYLKDGKGNLSQDAPVHYFTMMEGKWKSAETWPPESVKSTPIYFSQSNGLSFKKGESGSNAYAVDNSTGSGHDTRWKSITLEFNDARAYPDRKMRDSSLLVYESPVLEEEMEVTGHPIVNLYLSSDASDAHVIVYLEDVSPDGEVHYVTEGQIRAIHRKVCNPPKPFKDVVPYHSCRSADAQPLKPGEITELTFDLLPVSWLYQKGHKIRIAIAGADKDHFEIVNPEPHSINIHYGEDTPSNILLPVIPTGSQ